MSGGDRSAARPPETRAARGVDDPPAGGLVGGRHDIHVIALTDARATAWPHDRWLVRICDRDQFAFFTAFG